MCKSVPVALFYSYNKNYATKGAVTKINIKFFTWLLFKVFPLVV